MALPSLSPFNREQHQVEVPHHKGDVSVLECKHHKSQGQSCQGLESDLTLHIILISFISWSNGRDDMAQIGLIAG